MNFRVAFLLTIALVLGAIARPESQMMTTEDRIDRVMIGPVEYFKKRPDLPRVLMVPAGQTVLAPTFGTYDYLEIKSGGVLKFARDRSTTLAITHGVVLKGGFLDMGTEADPIPCGVSVELTIRDVPIDLTQDPYQWGNGLVNFGKQSRVGCQKTPFLPTTGGLAKGAQSATLTEAPDGWLVGDELLVPDTAAPILTSDGVRTTPTPSRRESKLTVASVVGTLVTFSKPLDFEHDNVVDANGVFVLAPRVVNLTRNIVIRSENEANPTVGTRGHLANLGADAKFLEIANEVRQMGRTTNHPLDDTNLSATPPHYGTNQRGKYAEHEHHTDSCLECAVIDSVFLGNNFTTKWAVSCHGCSDTLFERNVAVDFPGAGFVNEAGGEMRNVWRKNFGAYISGNKGDEFDFTDSVGIKQNCPGCTGNVFWLHQAANYFEDNEGWNSNSAWDFFNQEYDPGVLISTAPGRMPDTVPNNHVLVPLLFRNNVAVGNALTGLQTWAVTTFLNEGMIAANNTNSQVFGVLSDQIDHWMKNATIICPPGRQSVGIHASQAYSRSFLLDGGKMTGCGVGISGGGGSAGMTITHKMLLQNEIDIDMLPRVADLAVEWRPLGTAPPQYITLGGVGRFTGPIWSAADAFPDLGDSPWRNQQGSQWILRDFLGRGVDYRLLHVQSLEDNPAWYSGPVVYAWQPPVLGLTMKEAWNQFGLGYLGDMLLRSDAVPLEGIINGLGRAGLGIKYRAPLAVITFPTLREPALSVGEPGDGYMTVRGQAVGDPLPVDAHNFYYQVDDEAPINLADQIATGPSTDRSFSIHRPLPGRHTITVWLTKPGSREEYPGSRSTGEYCLGADCTVSVPQVHGLTDAYAVQTITQLVPLRVGNRIKLASSLPIGTALGTVPAAGTPVAQNALVDLVVSSGGLVVDPPVDVCPPPAGPPGVQDTVPGGLVLIAGQCVPPVKTDVPVPNVVGQARQVAMDMLTAAQLLVGVVTSQPTAFVTPGTVLSVTPGVGSVVLLGSTVDLVVASAVVIAEPPPHPVKGCIIMSDGSFGGCWPLTP